MSFEKIYNDSINQMEQLINDNYMEIENWEKFDFEKIENISSNMDGYDYCFAIAIGLVGTFVSTSNQLSEYLDEIHKAASGATGEYDFLQKFLGSILYHRGDSIDQMNGRFINRNNENAYGLFHRVLWGHDVLSFSQDNPFGLMFKQKGLMGIVQALRHLLADTMSHQGLPMPGSSFFDYENENGKISNYLINMSQNLSTESMGNKKWAEQVYSHMATIRFQDIMGGTTSKILTELYCVTRNIQDRMRKIQFQLITYSINFFGEAIIGAIRQGGVPYVNIPLVGMTIHKLVQLYYTSIDETKELHKKTNKLIEEDDELELLVNKTNSMITNYESAYEYHEELERADRQIVELLDFFEEE